MKLSFWTIIIMATFIAVGILSFAFFHQWIPTNKAVDNYTAYREGLEREAGKEGAARNRVKTAISLVQQKDNAWNAYVATRTPEPDVSRGGINLAVNPYQLTVDTQKFRNSIQRAVNAQVKRGGVKVVGVGPQVPGPADTDQAQTLLAQYYNYPGLAFPAVIFNFGPVTVSGTYAQIMANVRSYKSMPRYLAVTDALQISGTSPNLTGTYNLSIIGFIRGKEIYPSLETALAARAASLPKGAGAGAAGATTPGGVPQMGVPPVGGGR